MWGSGDSVSGDRDMCGTGISVDQGQVWNSVIGNRGRSETVSVGTETCVGQGYLWTRDKCGTVSLGTGAGVRQCQWGQRHVWDRDICGPRTSVGLCQWAYEPDVSTTQTRTQDTA